MQIHPDEMTQQQREATFKTVALRVAKARLANGVTGAARAEALRTVARYEQ